jgi:AcrR family transcriptional regulator
MTETRRPYRLQRRAERQAETRRRIVEAAVDLHSSLGPALVSLSAIAQRAGVQRHTLYAHFPTEQELFGACSAHWRAQNPFPDAEAWWRIDDPRRRLRRALTEVYEWYERVEPALALFRRDAHVFPEWQAGSRAELNAVADRLSAGLSRRKAVRAAVGHALEFDTYRSLVRGQGLGRRAAVNAMLAFVGAV